MAEKIKDVQDAKIVIGNGKLYKTVCGFGIKEFAAEKIRDLVNMVEDKAYSIKVVEVKAEFYTVASSNSELVRFTIGDHKTGVLIEILLVVNVPYLRIFRLRNYRSRMVTYGQTDPAPVVEDVLGWYDRLLQN